MKTLLVILILYCPFCNAQDTIYVTDKSDMRLFKYEDSSINYKHHLMYKGYLKQKLESVENLGEYIRVCDSLGFCYCTTQKEKDIIRTSDGHAILTKDGPEEHELVVRLVFGCCLLKFTYMTAVHKPVVTVIYKPITHIVRKHFKLPVIRDTVRKADVFVQYWHQVGDYKWMDSSQHSERVIKQSFIKH